MKPIVVKGPVEMIPGARTELLMAREHDTPAIKAGAAIIVNARGDD